MKKLTAVIIFVITFCMIPVFAYQLTQEEKILRAKVVYKAGANYVKDILYQGDTVLRWNRAYFPIKVYKVNGKVPNYYYQALKFATDVWSEETNGLIKFQYTDNENDANIVYKILDKNSPDDTLAYTQATILDTWFWGKKLQKAYINVYKKDKNGEYLDPRSMTNVIVHEMGHALGLQGHSDDPSSLMYTYYSSKNSKTSPYLNGEDLNTIRLLYRITPEITNGDINKEQGNWITKKVLFPNN